LGAEEDLKSGFVFVHASLSLWLISCYTFDAKAEMKFRLIEILRATSRSLSDGKHDTYPNRHERGRGKSF
jgi:hypothetical protein